MRERALLHYLVKLLSIAILVMQMGACGSFAYHNVRKGESLYSISWRYGEDYKKIAEWNGIKPPYIIHEGDRLRITAVDPAGQTLKASSERTIPRQSQPRTKPDTKIFRAPEVKANAKAALPSKPSSVYTPGQGTSAPEGTQANRKPEQNIPSRKLTWSWPAHGNIVNSYSNKGSGKKGIDIAGEKGAPVKAAAFGRVVYSGSGLQHYGKLIIIKHNAKYLSAYAHNKKLLVNEGAVVQQGQKIAEMGQTGTGVDRVMLHFEIRADGAPVNPMLFLPARGK